MGKGAGPAPDYRGAAEEQGRASQQAIGQQTQANRPNVNTPWATQQWSQDPFGRWTLNSGLSGGLQAGAESLTNQAGQAMSNPLDPSLFGPVQSGDAARNQAISGAYGQATSRLDPMFAQREQGLSAQLANQGLDPNSEAARNAMGNFGRERNDAYSSAMNAAIGQGTAAGDSAFRNNLLAQQQSLANALRQRSAPLESLAQLQGLSQTPQFHAAGAADPTNYFGAANAAGNFQVQDAQMKNQFWGDLAGGLFGLGGGVMSMFPWGK